MKIIFSRVASCTKALYLNKSVLVGHILGNLLAFLIQFSMFKDYLCWKWYNWVKINFLNTVHFLNRTRSSHPYILYYDLCLRKSKMPQSLVKRSSGTRVMSSTQRAMFCRTPDQRQGLPSMSHSGNESKSIESLPRSNINIQIYRYANEGMCKWRCHSNSILMSVCMYRLTRSYPGGFIFLESKPIFGKSGGTNISVFFANRICCELLIAYILWLISSEIKILTRGNQVILRWVHQIKATSIRGWN